MQTHSFVEKQDWDGSTEVVVVLRKCPSSVAQLAANIAERWALVAAMPDGEDSAGRQKLRLPATEELVARSCDLAAGLWQEFEKRGWIMDLPEPKPKQRKNEDGE